MKTGHIGLNVTDLARSTAFYRTPVSRTVRGDRPTSAPTYLGSPPTSSRGSGWS